jgi:hypothetical protein
MTATNPNSGNIKTNALHHHQSEAVKRLKSAINKHHRNFFNVKLTLS